MGWDDGTKRAVRWEDIEGACVDGFIKKKKLKKGKERGQLMELLLTIEVLPYALLTQSRTSQRYGKIK
jgi:hypothetical protein